MKIGSNFYLFDLWVELSAQICLTRLCRQSRSLPAKWPVAQQPLQFLDRSLLLQRREDDQLHVRGVADAKARIFEQHSPSDWMIDALVASERPRHLALRPPARKLGTQAR